MNPSDDELCIIALPQELIALDEVHNCIVRCSQQREFSSVAPRPLFEELRLVAGGFTKMRNWLKGVDKLIATLADNAVTLPSWMSTCFMNLFEIF